MENTTDTVERSDKKRITCHKQNQNQDYSRQQAFHPCGFRMRFLRADDQHDAGGIERREDTGFVIRAQLVRQCQAGEENRVPLPRAGAMACLESASS